MLVEVIGEAAMLEQTAEECVELAHACLKYARYLRGENKVYKSKNDILQSMAEEAADVLICIEELIDGGIVTNEDINSEINTKLTRMRKRLEEK